MSTDKRIWRRGLFCALGQGFKDDATVRDGIHLRWMMNPKLGLPFKGAGRGIGLFRIYFQFEDADSLRDVDLFEVDPVKYAISSSKGNLGPGQIVTTGGRHYFLKPTDPGYLTPTWKFYTHLHEIASRPQTQGEEAQALIGYMEEIMRQLQPVTAREGTSEAFDEVAAIDLQFTSKVTKTAASATARLRQTGRRLAGKIPAALRRDIDPKAALSSVARRLSKVVEVSAGREANIYAWVKAYDKSGHLLDKDWVGLLPGSPGVSIGGMPLPQKTKMTARLRAPGIMYYTVEPVAGQPVVSEGETRWVFCENYCRSPIWQPDPKLELRFRATPGYHTAAIVKDEHYAPFLRETDWAAAADAIDELFVQDPDVQAMLTAGNTYDMYTSAKVYKEESVSDQHEPSTMHIPVMAGLMQAGIDPVMARILGLYAFIAWQAPIRRDFKVEAFFPFFTDENLDALDSELAQIRDVAGEPFFRDPADKLAGTRLCGLVLGPEVAVRPAPPTPESFTSEIYVADVPSGRYPGEADLLVNASLKIPIANDVITLSNLPVAYEVQRRMSDMPFQNVLEDETDQTDAFHKIGIVPPVFLPKKEHDVIQSPLDVRDTFSFPARKESIQHRIRAFDIFGRPSDSITGPRNDIELPCKRPLAPTNVSARAFTSDDRVHVRMEICFSVAVGQGPLEAIRKRLEIVVHGLPDDTTQAAGAAKWSGGRPALKLELDFDSAGEQLLVNSMNQGCLLLSWQGDELLRDAEPDSTCEVGFAGPPPWIEQEDNPLLDETATGLRTYCIELSLGTKSGLGPGVHLWCARLRITGQCAECEIEKHSLEPCVQTQLNIAPPPPDVLQPPLPLVPQSTYPDCFGDSYYTIDLEAFVPPSLRSQEPMLNIYKATLDRLTGNMDALVDGPYLLDQDGMGVQQAAKASRLKFQRLTREPLIYCPSTRYYRVQVPGNLEQYHVVGVIGTNPYLEEKKWDQCGVVLFKTPAPVPLPTLNLRGATTVNENGNRSARFAFDSEFPPEFLSPDHGHRVQLMRKDLTTAQPAATYVDTFDGVIEEELATPAVCTFLAEDDQMQAWHRYEYEAYLLVYSPVHGRYFRQPAGVHCELLSAGTTSASPFDIGVPAGSASSSDDGYVVQLEFLAGEFDFSLTKIRPDNSAMRLEGRFSRGRLIGLPADSYAFTAGARYQLTLRDMDPEPGSYTFRLSFGQQFVWSKKLEVAS